MSLNSLASPEDAPLSPFEVGYLTAVAQDSAYDTVMRIFREESARDGRITRAFLARRTGMNPAQITRNLAGPGNWTLETYAKLLAAMGYVPKIEASKFTDLRWNNEHKEIPLHSTGTGSSRARVVEFNTEGWNRQITQKLERAA